MSDKTATTSRGTAPTVIFIICITGAIFFKIWVYLFSANFQLTGELPCRNGELCFIKDCSTEVCLRAEDDGMFYYKKFTAQARSVSEQCTNADGFLGESCVETFCATNPKSCQVEYCSGEQCRLNLNE
jgi:hypothetical protein